MASREPSARSLSVLALACVACAACLTGCAEPDQFLPTYQPGGPQAILGGSLTYAGPLPCTESGHVVGAAVLEGFDARLLPPPDGLGTTATSLAAVGGDVLFGSVVDRLTFNADGSRWCPAAGSQVTVSGDWTMGPLPGGIYEVRGFYDLGGQFDPAFSITKTPHQGDIAGGAIDNAAAVLTGAAPVYRQITAGTEVVNSMGIPTGAYSIPATGSNIEGIAVTLALPLPLGLPIYYPSGVYYATSSCVNGVVTPANPPTATLTPISCLPADGTASSPSKAACTVNMPSDYTLPVFNSNPTATEQSLTRVVLTAGVAPGDVAAAEGSPFNLPVASPTLNVSWPGTYTAASSLVPALFPLSIFSKLATTTDDITAQASPAVIIQGLTIYKSLLDTVISSPPANGPGVSVSTVVTGIVPAVLCLDPTDFSPNAVAMLVLSHKTDCTGNQLLTEEQTTLAALKAQLGRTVVPVQGCLPQGNYALNFVYDTGQAWTVPNEAGVCAGTVAGYSPTSEVESAAGTQCSTPSQPGAMRPRLSSQDVVLNIGPPTDAAYCVANPTPPCCLQAGMCTQ
jgi:hypothetical protein